MHDIPNGLSLLTLDVPGTLLAITTDPSSCSARVFFCLALSASGLCLRVQTEPPAASAGVVPDPRVELKLNKIAMMKLQEAARFPLTVFCGGTGRSWRLKVTALGLYTLLYHFAGWNDAHPREGSRRGSGFWPKLQQALQSSR